MDHQSNLHFRCRFAIQFETTHWVYKWKSNYLILSRYKKHSNGYPKTNSLDKDADLAPCTYLPVKSGHVPVPNPYKPGTLSTTQRESRKENWPIQKLTVPMRKIYSVNDFWSLTLILLVACGWYPWCVPSAPDFLDPMITPGSPPKGRPVSYFHDIESCVESLKFIKIPANPSSLHIAKAKFQWDRARHGVCPIVISSNLYNFMVIVYLISSRSPMDEFNFSCQFQCLKWTTASYMHTNKNLLNCIRKISKCFFFQIKYIFVST